MLVVDSSLDVAQVRTQSNAHEDPCIEKLLDMTLNTALIYSPLSRVARTLKVVTPTPTLINQKVLLLIYTVYHTTLSQLIMGREIISVSGMLRMLEVE